MLVVDAHSGSGGWVVVNVNGPTVAVVAIYACDVDGWWWCWPLTLRM